MPRIRKKTSNRQNTRDRKKITKKVKEHNKKSRKASKKDVTWKSNKKKDTVIPNSFPFKDKVLAEQAEEKRAADEAKIAAKRKPVEEEEDAPGIGSVNSTVLTATASLPSAKSTTAAEAEQDDVPDLIDTQITTLQDCLDRADVVLQVVDARDIAGCRNKWVEGLVSDAGGKFGLIINKVDLVPREVLESWLPHLPEYTFLFKSFLPTTNIPASSSSKTQLPHNPEQCLGKDELLAAFAAWSAEIQAKKKDKEEPVVISLFGLPNVGKTSVLNSLLGHAKGKYAVAPVVPLASQAKDLGTTTRMPVEVAVTGAEGVKVHVIDTPGWEPAPEDMDEEEEEDEDEDGELTEAQVAKFDRMEATLAGDLLRRNIGRIDKIKDVFPLANYVISRSNPQDLMLAYDVPYFTPGDVDGFLTSLARVGARMKKGGEADIDSAARLLMRDWSYNTFPYYSIPPKASAPNATTPSSAQTSVLEKIRSKKDMRTAGKGLVRFKGGEVDEREVILDDDYTTMGASSDDEEEEEDFDEEDEEDEEDDEDEEEVGSDEDVPILIGADEGEELDLEDGPEPSSGSDVEDDEDEESEEEEPIEDPVAVPKSQLKRKLAEPESQPVGKQAKRARSGTVTSVNGKGKANGKAAAGGSGKSVSFGKDVVFNAKEAKQGKASNKRKR